MNSQIREKIAILGVGYVGLPTATCLASFGHTVYGYDNNPTKVNDLSTGRTPMWEPGLQSLLREGLSSKRLKFTHDLIAAVNEATIVFICLPTPPKDDGGADMRIIYDAVLEMREHLQTNAILVIKSSVPMGESHSIELLLSRDDIHIVSNPEFLREGHAIQDTLKPHRIVVGARDESVARAIASLFQSGAAPTLVTDSVTAETIKYASNAFLATKTSFVNQVTSICEVVGASSEDVLQGMSLDPRIGSGHMRPGPGWGGPCLTKDSNSLLSIGREHGFEFSMVQAAIDANESHVKSIIEKIEDVLNGGIESKTVAVWGLTFKADTDDMRNSPALDIASRLASRGAIIRAYDPMIERNERTRVDFLTKVENPYEACRGSEILIVLTEWNEFKNLDFERVGVLLANKVVFDTRNILDPRLLRTLGFSYQRLGR